MLFEWVYEISQFVFLLEWVFFPSPTPGVGDLQKIGVGRLNDAAWDCALVYLLRLSGYRPGVESVRVTVLF